jgi:hypothetical protein
MVRSTRENVARAAARIKGAAGRANGAGGGGDGGAPAGVTNCKDGGESGPSPYLRSSAAVREILGNEELHRKHIKRAHVVCKDTHMLYASTAQVYAVAGARPGYPPGPLVSVAAPA